MYHLHLPLTIQHENLLDEEDHWEIKIRPPCFTRACVKLLTAKREEKQVWKREMEMRSEDFWSLF
jgi:hypothetical protein